MTALQRQAADPLAARTLLQALLPRIRAERVLVPKYGHGIDEAWQRPADTVADLVAECFVAVKRHAGEDRDDVARLVLQEATRKLRSARQVQRRYQLRTALLLPDHQGYAAADLSASPVTGRMVGGRPYGRRSFETLEQGRGPPCVRGPS